VERCLVRGGATNPLSSLSLPPSPSLADHDLLVPVSAHTQSHSHRAAAPVAEDVSRLVGSSHCATTWSVSAASVSASAAGESCLPMRKGV
jgi:hypothetical protein